MTVYEVEVHVALATDDDAQTVIVDYERWRLPQSQMKHQRVSVNHCQFVTEVNMLTDLCKVCGKDVAHFHTSISLGACLGKHLFEASVLFMFLPVFATKIIILQ